MINSPVKASGRNDTMSYLPIGHKLTTAFGQFIDACNDRCEPFAWTGDADELLAKVGPSKSDRELNKRHAVLSTPYHLGLRPLTGERPGRAVVIVIGHQPVPSIVNAHGWWRS